MSLEVIEVRNKNETTCTVVIESDQQDGGLAYTELRGPACRRLAIMRAAQEGLAQPGVNQVPITYPVDANGKEVTDPAGKFHRFRADVSVTRRIA